MTTAVVAAPAEASPATLDLDARLALADAAMSVRLDEASMEWGVNTCRQSGPDWWAAVTAAPPPAPDPGHATSVAGLLQRAHRRLLGGGWCRGYAVDGQGAVCLAWAIHREARGDVGLEVAALNHLLDQIRADLDPDAQTVPSWNDRQTDARMPLRILGAATDTAHQRGI